MRTQSWFARSGRIAAIFVGLLIAFPALAQSFVHDAVAPGLAKLHSLGRMNPTNTLDLCIGLPLRNQEALTNTLRDLYDPASPRYHHWLTPAQFDAQFGPTTNDYQKVKDFAGANGFAITGTHGDRELLDVRASVADIEKVFRVEMHFYQHPTEARRFHSPDSVPWVDSSVPILTVGNLNDYTLPHPLIKPNARSHQSGGVVPESENGSGPDGTYVGGDFRQAYASAPSGDFGDGQYVGLLEFNCGFSQSDIQQYWNATGYTYPGGGRVPVTAVMLDGYDGSLGNANIECSLDIEMAISMAPHLSGVYVFEGSIQNHIFSDMVTNYTFIKQFSASWGFGIDATSDNYFLQMWTQGQSFFISSGDTDAYANGVTSGVNYANTDPNVTVVGGTTLTTDSSHNYSSESVWNWGYTGTNSDGSPKYVGSTGGVATGIGIPNYQLNAGFQANGGSLANRNVPDVALTADNVWVVYSNGVNGAVGGTSCAAPLWAGYAALANEQAAEGGNASAGFINFKIYRVYEGLDVAIPYSSAFHDVTSGNNSWPGSGGLYSAGTGADNCTGLGSPGGVLFSALSDTEGYWWVHDPIASGGDGWFWSPTPLSAGISAMQTAPVTGTIVLLNGSSSPGAYQLSTPCKIIAVGGTSTIGP